MVKRSAAQENLLSQIRIAHTARLTARIAAEEEARVLVAKRLNAAYLAESRLVRTALNAGISRRAVGLEGLGSGDYATITKLLEYTEDEARQDEIRLHGDGRVKLVDDPAARVSMVPAYGQAVPPRGVPIARVDWQGYEPKAGGDRVDLAGFVRLADDGTYWTGLTDEIADEPGDGVLWFEARTAGTPLHSRLMTLLNEA